MISLYVPYRTEFVANLFFSTLLHLFALFIMLTVPFFGDHIDTHPFLGYFVFLSGEADSIKKSLSVNKFKRLSAVQKTGVSNAIKKNPERTDEQKSNVNDIQTAKEISGQEIEESDLKADIDKASSHDIATNNNLLIIDNIQQPVFLMSDTEKKEEVISKSPIVIENVEKNERIDTMPVVNIPQENKEKKGPEQKIYSNLYKSENEVLHITGVETFNGKVVEPMTQDITISSADAPELNKQEKIIEKRNETAIEVIDKEDLPSGIPISDIFFLKDINLELSFKVRQKPEIDVMFFQKAHPKDLTKGKIKQVEFKEDIAEINGKGYKIIYSVLKAEKGAYTIRIENKSNNTYVGDISFYIYKGKDKERIKVYDNIKFVNDKALNFRFILPEAIFWDDEDYFSGSIEDSRYITKFNRDTGLSWKEEKD